MVGWNSPLALDMAKITLIKEKSPTLQSHNKAPMKRIEVAAAIIHDNQGRIFATQRGYGDWKDYWEFPGGKIEPAETPQQALTREIQEELNTQITIERHVTTIEYDYPTFHLTMHCYLCTLKEHEAARWLPKDQLRSVNWLPADLSILDKL